jgi:phosphatidylserine/phosphatidylglycerophosphate/cardiolipin synthase-like enzyme
MPDRLDLASRQVDGGYYLVRRAARPEPFVARGGSAHDGYRHCFTYWDSARTIRHELEAMIRGARRKVFVASFLIGDAALHDALVGAADRLVGGVYVITQLDEQRLERGLAELELQDEPGADLQALKNRFDEMTRHGIYVRGHPNLHAKFVVVDDEVALVSSANLMTSALDRTGEDGVVVRDPSEVDRLARLFARLWHTGCRYEARPGEAYALRPLAAAPWTAPVPAPEIGAHARVIWTDGAEHHILRTIQDIVDGARRELVLASFSLKDLRRRPKVIFDHIVGAVGRGVRVQLLVRPRASRHDHMGEVRALAEAGAEVFADRETHAKAAIADGQHGALFSANIDLQHGLTNGVEVGCRLDGSAALAEARRYFAHALDQAQLVYRLHPTHGELDEALDAPGRVRWPLGARTLVRADASNRRRFEQGVEAGPVLFLGEGPRRKAGEANSEEAVDGIELLAGHDRWKLETGGSDEPCRLVARPTTPDDKTTTSLLDSWLQPDAGHGRRGLVATVIEWVS